MSEKKQNRVRPANPSLTPAVKNPEVEEAMKVYAREQSADALNRLIEKMRLARFLVPALIDDEKRPRPCLIKAPTGELLFPAYTCMEQIPKEANSPGIINMPFLAINSMVANPQGNAAGIVFNPFTDNLLFKMPLVQRIDEVERQRQQAPKVQPEQLSQEQYAVFERRRFEFEFLPGRFFEQGGRMMDELCEEQEAYIDRLFEEAYQHRRMYPYLPEDFSVMVMNLSEEMVLVRVDLPGKDMGIPSCYRVYLAWDRTKERGRYFTIERTAEKGVHHLGEMRADLKHVDYGAAPVEGAELQRIVDLIKVADEEKESELA